MKTKRKAGGRDRRLLRNMTAAGLCLALCMLMPFLAGQIPAVGRAISPMHIPVFLAGFLCGPLWAMAVGGTAPLLRHFWLQMPPLITAVAMTFELAAYGFVSGALYRRLPRRRSSIYIALIAAMAAGRVVWGVAMVVISGVSAEVFTWDIFLSNAVITALPGIVVHITVIPVLVMALQRAGAVSREGE